jgi:foldase protein PrsA
MEMKTRLPFLLLSVVLAATLAACGGGSSGGSVPPDSIATVGTTPITKSTFTALMGVACANYKLQGQPCPKVGTPTYSSLRASAVNFLVQQEELAQKAQTLGVTITQKDLDNKVAQIKKTYYQGSDKKFQQALKKQGLSLSGFEQYELRPSLLSQKTKAKVTSSVKISNAAALKYYNQNKATFTTPETREVRHILVKSKSLAQRLEQQVKNGANFAKLAKKYSTDTSSAAQGGKLCVAHGTQRPPCITTVPPFDKATFSLKTNEVSLVHSVYGWHVLQAISKITPAQTQSFKTVESQIKANLASQQQTTAWNTWLAQLTNDYKGKVSYQTGYEPATTSTPTTTT